MPHDNERNVAITIAEDQLQEYLSLRHVRRRLHKFSPAALSHLIGWGAERAGGEAHRPLHGRKPEGMKLAESARR
jgi:hypothetical protein